MLELVNVNPQEFGIKEEKSSQVSKMFKPMLDAMESLEVEFNEIIKLGIEDLDTIKKASALRKKYVKTRTGTAKIHKELKAEFLAGGRFVDGWKNAQLMASTGKEEKLKEIEDHYKNKEIARIAELQSKRASLISKFTDVIPESLGQMDDTIWINFYDGSKANHEVRVKAEHRAEQEKLKQIEDRLLEEERIRKENEELKAQAEERERKAQVERKAHVAELERQRKEQEAIKKKEEEKARIEREKLQAQIDKQNEIAKKKAQEEEAKLKAGDGNKMQFVIDDLIKAKGYEFKSSRNQKIFNNVADMIDKVVGYIETNK